MALPDWNADIQAGKTVTNPKWSPCSPTKLSISKQQEARHGKALLNAGPTIADSAETVIQVSHS